MSKTYYNIYKDSSGNVGIGTTSPTRKLHIDGGSASSTSIYIDANSINGTDIEQSASDFRLQVRDNIPLLFFTNNSEKVRVAADGNVGIGTTSPSHKLAVAGTIGGSLYSSSYIEFPASGGDQGNTIIKANDDVKIGFSQTFVVKQGGNVGIGVSPAYKLHIQDASDPTIRIQDSTNNSILDLRAEDSTVLIRSTGNHSMRFDVNQTERMRIDTNGNVGINTTSPASRFHVVNNDFVLFENTTASANSLLKLKTASRTWQMSVRESDLSGALTFRNETAGTDNLVINTSGNVGIGTTSPREKLNIDSGNFVFTASKTGDADIQSIIWHNTNSTGFDVAKIVGKTGTNIYEGIIRFETKDSGGTMAERMRIASNGSVGIGTTSPSSGAKLEVAGNLNLQNSGSDVGLWLDRTDAREYRLYVDSNGVFNLRDQSAGSARLVVKTDGNVGIGTSSPASKLHIDTGSIQFDKTNTASGGDFDFIKMGYNGSWSNNANGLAAISVDDGGGIVGRYGITYDNFGKFVITDLYNSGYGASGDVFEAQGDGKIIFNKYGSGTFTGTQAYVLAVDSSGNIIETNSGSGSVTSSSSTTNYLTKWTNGGSEIIGNSVAYDDGTNIGIGTTSPTAKLDIRGTGSDGGELLRIESDGDVADAGYHWMSSAMATSQTTNASMIHLIGVAESTKNSGYFGFHYAGAGSNSNYLKLGGYAADNLLIIKMDGNVGIGTTSPAYKLDVSGDASFNGSGSSGYVYIRGNSGLGGATTPQYKSGMIFGWNRSNGYGESNIIFTDAGAGSNVRLAIQFWDNSTLYDYVSVNSSGNVGIGSTGPINRLQVVPSTSGGSSSNASEDAAYFGGNELGGVGGYTGIRLGGFGTSGYGTYIRSVKTTSYGNYWNEAITFSVTRTNTSSTVDEVMRITSGGNVGIGTTSPSYKLHVSDTADATTGLLVTNSSTGTGARATLVLNSDAAGMQLYATGSSYNGVAGWADSGVISTDSSSSGGLKLNSQVGGISFQTSTSTKMIVLASGSVGIGTTSPTSNLQIQGATNGSLFSVRTSSGLVGAIQDSAGYGELILYQAGGGVKAHIHGNANSYLLGGNLGIGTTSPDSGLTIAKAQTSAHTYTTNHLHLATPTTTNNGGATTISFATSTVDNYGWSLSAIREASNGNDTRFAFKSHNNSDSGSEVLSVLAEGNVGIGTTSPSAKLDIAGVLNDPPTIRLTNTTTSVSLGDSLGEIQFYNSDATDFTPGVFGIIRGVAHASGGEGSIQILTDMPSEGTPPTNVTAHFNVDGNVGIGTTSPGDKLSVVNGNISLTDSYKLYNGSANDSAGLYFSSAQVNISGYSGIIFRSSTTNVASQTERMRITNGGSVGIGTSSPSSLLQIGAGSFPNPNTSYDIVHLGGLSLMGRNNRDVYISGNAYYATSGWLVKYGGYQPVLMDMLDGRFVWNIGTGTTAGSGAGFSEKMRLDSTGLGIGTTSPTQKLHVVGKALITDDVQLTGSNPRIDFNSNGASSLRFYDTTNAAERARFNTDGNLGIGTTSPSSTLHVVDGTSGASAFKVDGTSGTIFEVTDDLSSSLMSVNTIAGLPAFEVFADYHIVAGRYNQNDFYLDTNGNLGLGTATPKAPLHVGDGSAGNYFGGKTFSLSNTFADALSITLPDDTACYVKLFVNGNWSGHSSVAFVAEYFIQNGGNSYNEPGLIISETDNTFNGTVTSQIVDSTTDTFVIQIKLSTTGSFTANLSYQVMGAITSIS